MRHKIILFFVFLALSSITAQIDSISSGNIDIFVIDSYITPEPPYKFTLSFYTSDSCTSKIIFDNKKEFVVSEKLNENHKIEIELNGIISNKNSIQYRILVYDKNNVESKSQLYDLEVPQNIIYAYKKNVNLFQVCCFGGIIFGLPSPTYISKNNKNYFGLTKEIPVFSFYKGSFNYPFGYIGLEYAYVFNTDRKNFLRAGYKQIIQISFIKYISAGLNYFTDLKGYNGVSPELSLGLFQIQNVFTAFIRYRYNFQPDRGGTDFHEISVGLYSNFFSINF